jgi:hypothetical protein
MNTGQVVVLFIIAMIISFIAVFGRFRKED